MNDNRSGDEGAAETASPQRNPRVEPHNVIILTGGLTGSSALAGLLTAGGYWSGDDTFKKTDYNTYENADLIRLNRQLMKRVSIGEEYTQVFQPAAIGAIGALAGVEPEDEYRAFLQACEQRVPWLWKDPRLWLTIRFWHPMVDWSRVRVLLLRRDPMQAWISTIQRRQIQTFRYLAAYNDSIQRSLVEFLESNEIGFLSTTYEDLVMTPEREIDRIAKYIGAPLTLDQFTSTYSGPLYKRPKTWRDAIEAGLIYLKNFNERIG